MIPINKPLLGDEEDAEIREVLESGQLTSSTLDGGVKVRSFQKLISSYIGVKHAVAVNSGTSALYAALKSLNIGRGDEVLLPSMTFVATANVVLSLGARPVFVDISLKDFNIDVKDLESRTTGRSRAVIPVHLYGYPAKMDEVNEVAEKHGLHVVEDAAQSLGGTYRGRQTGSMGRAGCLSFYPSKVITGGEGGCILTDSDNVAEKALSIRNHGMDKSDDTVTLGLNLRMPEISAAILCAQMRKLDMLLKARRENAEKLGRLLSSEETLVLPREDSIRRSNWYLYTVLVKGDRDLLLKRLREDGIGAVAYYNKPVHRRKLFSSLGYAGKGLRNTEYAAQHVVSLPVHPSVTEDDLEHVARSIKRTLD